MQKDVNGQDLDWRKMYLETKHAELLSNNNKAPGEKSEQEIRQNKIEKLEKEKKKK